MKWELETNGTLGQGGEYIPVQYPRSNENRGQSDDMNKGGASRTDSIATDRVRNTDGNGESAMQPMDVDYGVGTYPKGFEVNEDMGGVDEGDGASR